MLLFAHPSTAIDEWSVVVLSSTVPQYSTCSVTAHLAIHIHFSKYYYIYNLSFPNAFKFNLKRTNPEKNPKIWKTIHIVIHQNNYSPKLQQFKYPTLYLFGCLRMTQISRDCIYSRFLCGPCLMDRISYWFSTQQSPFKTGKYVSGKPAAFA